MRYAIALVATLIAGLALGAAGDAIYRVQESKQITTEQALQFAQLAKTVGGWSGTAADMRSVCVSRNLGHDGNFVIEVQGVKRAPLSSIVGGGDGVTVEGIATE